MQTVEDKRHEAMLDTEQRSRKSWDLDGKLYVPAAE